MEIILALIGIPLFIGLCLFLVGSLTLTAITTILGLATFSFFPIAALDFILWLITDSVILSLLITAIFGFIVISISDRDAKSKT